ncbi:L-threonylcarbamoyladenylate synthase [Methylobacter sp. S3L5C]|uniref:L-threonylcarbamoyladenylate synthase n=1 Tax=Methylobacter sp. S3L5C TaxID=2839024 RepID=UPI001FAC240D|nr:L-threonylcarbamoyladenylate synthase [Methylobacter sp. S3L5C]UOA09054.1 threonylcarbamoyl-AMP synthase [Methylobacter sp. S3L5C]
MKPIFADAAAIEHAVKLLQQGRLVAFPTETVYGLGADAANPDAVRRIFKAKGRPADHPLIVHIASTDSLNDWAQSVPDSALKLAAQFWPGPLALILNKKPEVSSVVTGGQDTVGLRVPGHPVALSLLREFGGGIAAPSANRFCRISPTQAVHVEEELGNAVDLILDGGACQVGVESTIVDLSGTRPKLLRPGYITQFDIEAVLQTEMLVVSTQSGQTDSSEQRAPGMMAVHYAPITVALLCPTERLPEMIQTLNFQNKKVGILAYSLKPAENTLTRLIRMPKQADDYAQALYASLRDLDSLQLDIILVEQPPETAAWRAINDRIGKATSAC